MVRGSTPQAADVTSFDDVYRAHRHQVLGWALRFTAGRRDLAEDLAQDVFFRLHARLPHLGEADDLASPFRESLEQPSTPLSAM